MQRFDRGRVCSGRGTALASALRRLLQLLERPGEDPRRSPVERAQSTHPLSNVCYQFHRHRRRLPAHQPSAAVRVPASGGTGKTPVPASVGRFAPSHVRYASLCSSPLLFLLYPSCGIRRD
jgi:hypothetical protein